MIVVIDSSVWVSALQFAGRNTPPILAVEKALRRGELATTREIHAEVQRTLIEKFRWGPSKANRIIGAYLKNARSVDISRNLHVCRDPNDDMVLECALVAGAEIILTGDKDLLALDPFQGIRILTPSEFLAVEG